jgi:hypothetical protein
MQTNEDLIIRTCNHIKSAGEPCGSPAMRNEHYCYHHLRYRRNHDLGSPDYEVPILDDPDSVQLLINDVIRSLVKGSIDQKKATAILYAAQLASNNVKACLQQVEYIDDDDDDESETTEEDEGPSLAEMFMKTLAEMKEETDC